jgi:hypothetical protein
MTSHDLTAAALLSNPAWESYAVERCARIVAEEAMTACGAPPTPKMVRRRETQIKKAAVRKAMRAEGYGWARIALAIAGLFAPPVVKIVLWMIGKLLEEQPRAMAFECKGKRGD